jgi:hypothetical protein
VFKIQRTFIDCCLLTLLLTTLFLLLSLSATGQERTNSQATRAEVASKNKPAEMKQPKDAATATAPVYKDFMGVTLGMEADEVRAKLGHLKDKGERQDFFVFSESQSAQIGYDEHGKVTVISVDYVTKNDGAPSPESVLGEAVQAKPDGSIYLLKRYPAAGYWVAYSRTAGDNPIVTVTMQKI